jgi:hypothetical protein
MMHPLRLILLSSLAVACAFFEPDDDGDGLSDVEERSLGTDPQLVDSDADGLPDAIEVDAGTDPLLGDTDGDGGADGDEVAVGTDPLDAQSGPYPTGWPQLSVASWEAWSELPECQRGVIVGCRAPDVALPDYRGFDFRTRDVVANETDMSLVIVSHGGQTGAMAAEFENGDAIYADMMAGELFDIDWTWLHSAVASDRVRLNFVSYNAGLPGTPDDQVAWSEAIAASGFIADESDTPVLWDRDGDFLAWLGPRPTPHLVLLDRELRVITRDYFEEVGVRGLDVLASVVAGAPDVIQPAR